MQPENMENQPKPSLMEKLSLPIAIVIAGALIAFSLYYSNEKSSQYVKNPLPDNSAPSINVRAVSADDHIIGNPNADVIVVEYSDTECPFCKQFHSTMRRIIEEYGKSGKVAWVYRHFPIDQLHSKARQEAEALECANELGGSAKFWEYTNLLYDTTTSNNSLDPAELPKMAKKVGLDVNAFNTCLSSGKYKDKVDADYQEIVKSGGRGTPTSILVMKDGTKETIPGALPYDQMKLVIDAALK